jgi:rhodanese-related sulfurtransferase
MEDDWSYRMIMKSIFILLAGVALFFSSTCGAAAGPGNEESSGDVPTMHEEYTAHPELPRIGAEELKKLMSEGNDFVIVDAQDSASYAKQHIDGAINIPYDPTGDPMMREMTLMALPMDKLIIVYCNCEDDGISAGLVMEMYDLGFELDMIKILSRGILRWAELEYPVSAKN